MPSILVGRGLATVHGFALSNTLLAIEYDGTLAPIATTSAGAWMRERTRRLLARAAQLYPIVVMSHRALSDLSNRFGGIPLTPVENRAVDTASARLPAQGANDGRGAGVQVITVPSASTRHRGRALQAACTQCGCDTAIYVGDHEPPDDYARSGGSCEVLAIRVGPVLRTKADFVLERQLEMDSFLRILLIARDERRAGKCLASS